MDAPVKIPSSIMMVAGEHSGELHGSRLVHELQKLNPDCKVFGIGGDLMREEGMELLFHVSDLSVMGFVEVLRHLPHIRNIFRACVREMRLRKPDVLVLIDYPGFNLRLAKKAKSLGIRIVYYISPQVWAWGKGRIPKMKKLIDQFAVILPFEEQIYQKAGIPVQFVGHPLLDVLTFDTTREEVLKRFSLPDKRILLLLPGSRKQEISFLLPVMIEAAIRIRKQVDCVIAVGASANVPRGLYDGIVKNEPGVNLLYGATHALMQHAHAVIVASGTATLETAIYLKPMVIVYKATRVSYEIARRLVSLTHIGIVNILVNRTIVPELIQHDFTAANIVKNILPLFHDEQFYRQTVEELRSVTALLGAPGAAERVAKIILRIDERKID